MQLNAASFAFAISCQPFAASRIDVQKHDAVAVSGVNGIVLWLGRSAVHSIQPAICHRTYERPLWRNGAACPNDWGGRKAAMESAGVLPPVPIRSRRMVQNSRI